MAPALAAVAALVVLAVAAQWSLHRNRQRLLAAIRASWGRPSARVRKMDAIAEYHRSKVLAHGPGQALDDRTWSDLDMDAVFQSLDRTESTLGQQVLYHRLRRQDASDLEPFEQLVDRLSHDAPAREQIQLALTGLREPDGYDLWWLTQADAVARPRWHLVFVAWAIIVFAAMVAIPWWPGAILIPVAGAAVNLLIRTKTVWRVSAMIGPFRQVRALVSAAEAVRNADLLGSAGPGPRGPCRARRSAPSLGSRLAALVGVGAPRLLGDHLADTPSTGSMPRYLSIRPLSGAATCLTCSSKAS